MKKRIFIKKSKKEIILSSALVEFLSKGIDALCKEDLLDNLIENYAKKQLLQVKKKVNSEDDCIKVFLYIKKISFKLDYP